MKTIHEIIREEYVFPDYKFASACLGTRESCSFCIKKGSKLISLRNRQRIPDNVKNLIIKLNKKDIHSLTTLDFLPPSIFHLDLPLPLISQGTFFSQVEVLILSNREEFYLADDPIEELKFPEIEFPKLKSLVFTGDRTESGTHWASCGLKAEYFPKLEYFSSLLDQQGMVEKFLVDLSPIQHLDLGNINNIDVFQVIAQNKHLRSVSLGHLGPKFVFSNLDQLKDLKALLINGSNASINCEIFGELEGLRELVIWGAKELSNLPSLLEIASLKNLELVDCPKAFKKGERLLFKNHGFDYLDIADV